MYDDDGLNFRSTIDHLYDIHKISGSQKLHNNTKDKKNNNTFEQQLPKKNTNDIAKERYKQIIDMEQGAEVFHIEQIMTHSAIIINDQVTIKDCFEIMKEQNIQQLLLREDTQNHLKGMVTKHDLINYIMENINNEDDPLSQTVENISQKNILTTDPMSDIRRVSKVMIDFNINAIPVVNKHEVILGIVTRHDIVKALSNMPHLQVWA
jgi:CBS domain-containing protein